jgi:hypothetical protein
MKMKNSNMPDACLQPNLIQMELLINDSKKIFSIQEDFNTLFPYLKLEFFSKPLHSGGAVARRLLSHDTRTLSECRTVKGNEGLTISPDMTVVDLEKNFKEVYGLGIQVFRKSGKVWLETTLTESWTLEEQNRQGESLSKM